MVEIQSLLIASVVAFCIYFVYQFFQGPGSAIWNAFKHMMGGVSAIAQTADDAVESVQKNTILYALTGVGVFVLYVLYKSGALTALGLRTNEFLSNRKIRKTAIDDLANIKDALTPENYKSLLNRRIEILNNERTARAVRDSDIQLPDRANFLEKARIERVRFKTMIDRAGEAGDDADAQIETYLGNPEGKQNIVELEAQNKTWGDTFKGWYSKVFGK